MNLTRTSRFTLGLLKLALLGGCNQSTILRNTSTAGGTPGLGEVSLLADSKPLTAIDFGPLDCGGTVPEGKSFVVKNDGEGPLKWQASLDSNAYFNLAGDHSSTLEPGEEAKIIVIAQAMPSSVDAGSIQSASILITTDDAARPEIYVALKATAQGATFELIAPSLADFGSLPIGTPALPLPFTVKNVGNAPAKLAIAAPGDSQFTFGWTGDGSPVEVAMGASLPGLVANFTPNNTNVSNSAGVLEVVGSVCGKSVEALPVKGQGLGGVIGISPGMIDLGKVGCNTQPDAQVITVYNTGNLVLTWKGELKTGGNFKLSPAGGAIAPGASSQLSLTTKKLGMTTDFADNALGDTLIITTSVGGDTPHEIPIKETASGGILTWTAVPVDFGLNTFGVNSAPKFVSVTNDGNAAVTVSINGSGQFTGTGGSVPGGGGKFVSALTYLPANLGAEKGTFGIVTVDPICQELPTEVVATGSGKGTAEKISLNGHVQRGSAQVITESGCILIASSGGKVACFGGNANGELGALKVGPNPTIVPKLKDIIGVASGGDFNCALDKAGDVFCWGNNRNRQNSRVGKLGVTNVDFTEVPQKVLDVSNATQISAGHNMACALLADTTVTCWGNNKRGNLGIGGLSGVTQIAVGGGGGCARLNDQTVQCWGRYSRGALGSGSSDGQSGAQTVSNINDALSVSATTSGSRGAARCALRMDGTVSCWGDNRHGQIGDGSTCCGGFSTPVMLGSLSGVQQVVGYRVGGCALMGDKTVRCWGRNHYGQVGDGTTFEQPNPTFVTGINDATAIAAGGSGACAIVTGGSVKCWGSYGAGSSSTPQTLKGF